MIEVNDIHTYYGRSHILQGISLNLKKGEVICLLGRNGAGKTTTLRSIMGFTPPKKGSIKFEGVDLAKIKDKEGKAFERRGTADSCRGQAPDDQSKVIAP